MPLVNGRLPRCGFTPSDIIPVSLDPVAANKSPIKIAGAIILRLQCHSPDSERDVTLKVKVDTGAQGNILPVRTFKRMHPELLDESEIPSK